MKVVAVTACSSGIAHTYMAAEALEVVAKRHDIDISVETQGAMGIENELSQEDIKKAVCVILTNDMQIINEDRFVGKKVIRMSTSDVIKKADIIMKKIITTFGK